MLESSHRMEGAVLGKGYAVSFPTIGVDGWFAFRGNVLVVAGRKCLAWPACEWYEDRKSVV